MFYCESLFGNATVLVVALSALEQTGHPQSQTGGGDRTVQDWVGLQDEHRGRRVHGPVAARGLPSPQHEPPKAVPKPTLARFPVISRTSGCGHEKDEGCS